MRIALVLLIVCLATSSAALRLLKSKLKPFAKYKYLQQPVVVTEPLPATFARPVSIYSVSSPPVATYAVPVQTYAAPVTYTQPLSVAYDAHPIVHLAQAQHVHFEPFGAHFIEEHIPYYDH